jgi:hypothetical protein
VPGTPLYREIEAQGRLLPADLADIHGQFQFNFQHPAISRAQSGVFLERAFQRDFERNGPSLYRICRTTLDGWMRYKSHPDLRIRKRFEREARQLKNTYNATLWAMERRLRSTNASISARARALRGEIEAEFGIAARLTARVLGPVLSWSIRREERRLARGRTYEPRTITERTNWIPT